MPGAGRGEDSTQLEFSNSKLVSEEARATPSMSTVPVSGLPYGTVLVANKLLVLVRFHYSYVYISTFPLNQILYE